LGVLQGVEQKGTIGRGRAGLNPKPVPAEWSWETVSRGGREGIFAAEFGKRTNRIGG